MRYKQLKSLSVKCDYTQTFQLPGSDRATYGRTKNKKHFSVWCVVTGVYSTNGAKILLYKAGDYFPTIDES